MAAGGVNVIVVLVSGIALALVCSLFSGMPVLDTVSLLGAGIAGMSELIIITLLAAGMLGVVKAAGGIDYLLRAISRPGLGYRGAQAAMCLITAAVNLCTANNTVAILMAATTNAIKYSVREKRPDSNTRNSFPSGHTANAFCGAELMRIEYGNWVGLAGYAVAVTTGVMRMYNERHWWNDVIAGAGIGILCARTAYWLLPLERKLFRRDRRISREHELEFREHERSKLAKKKETAFTAVPYYDASARGAGVAIAAFF